LKAQTLEREGKERAVLLSARGALLALSGQLTSLTTQVEEEATAFNSLTAELDEFKSLAVTAIRNFQALTCDAQSASAALAAAKQERDRLAQQLSTAAQKK
jgi:hypothetical protein